ncbi:hypothetical protein WR25_02954 [Diploscapter pachys]|uniref:receptor protein-tyrosine kinase n=1 Tax=Diploscapter pachys TaxID=2018661 RepID=A0A2A2JS69_9BILA|nr:hypothetical protein WR25_02954 [Diploscapter pachys]
MAESVARAQASVSFCIADVPIPDPEEEAAGESGTVRKMRDWKIWAIILIYGIFTLRKTGSQFCASGANDTEPQDDPFFQCNPENFSKIEPPPIQTYNSSGIFPLHYCNVAILLDLDQKITSPENFSLMFYFMKDFIHDCMSRGIGYKTSIYSMFNSANQVDCCSELGCEHTIDSLNYSTYVGNYDNDDPIQNETSNFNFTYMLISELKTYSSPTNRCLFNTVVLLTNRLFYSSVDSRTIYNEMQKIYNTGCITFTVIAVGREEITYDIMADTYANITTNVFAVTSFNCLDKLKGCIFPCGNRSVHECQDVQNLTGLDCPVPTTIAPTGSTGLTVTSTEIPTDSPGHYDAWHIIYLFALSNRTTNAQFQNVINYIGNPIEECVNSKDKLTVRFLARNNSDSLWIDDLSEITTMLASYQIEEINVPSSGSVGDELIDIYDTVTLGLINRAINVPLNQSHAVNRDPRITLLTDFASENFIEAYTNQSSGLWASLQNYDFQIICFDQEAGDYLKNKTLMKDRNLHIDPNYMDNEKDEMKLCENPAVKTIMYIIVGTCGGFMVLLFLATIIYRQKYMFAQKFAQFTKTHEVENLEEEEQDNDDLIDYWEISEEKLTIKTERLGHGAYGQVYKGKIRDVPPAIEKYHRSEIARYTDCDCAVKMLPKYASEQAKTEFVHEIELMKTLGFHEHIVNMLGCVTAGNRCCLLMEYCSEKDLLRYLKLKKVELEMSKSIDDQIEVTKEFLNFAWQVSQGMIWLQERNVIHRDLAARNILISGHEGMRTAKISDFGLAIMGDSSQTPMSCAGRLPIKWLALESLEHEEFSFQSDIWSFGIVLFEMYSMGDIPFADIEPTELIPHLRAGNRPKRPLLAVDKVAETMSQCWDKDPKMRPSFDQLRGIFATLLDQATEGYGYLALIKTTDYRLVSEINNREENVGNYSAFLRSS